jgi:hypothetical protein
MEHYGLLPQLAFRFEFLLCLFQNSVIDNAIESKFFVDDAGADVFVEHDLDAVLSDREIGGITWAE